MYISWGPGESWFDEEIAFVETTFSAELLERVLAEDYVGDPLIINSKYTTSATSVHHLYHLARFFSGVHCEPQALRTVLEWGGGYGNFAKIFLRLRITPVTYVIIDLPLMSCIQWLYLGTALGTERVKLLMSPSEQVAEGKINLVPVGLWPQVWEPAARVDLFVSTWALSECTAEAQDYVAGQAWFNAKHLLLACGPNSPDFPWSERLGKLALASGAVMERAAMPDRGHYYFFL